MNRCGGHRRTARSEQPSAPESSVGAVAVVHPRLSHEAAKALVSAGFARLTDTGGFEVWLRYPGPVTKQANPKEGT